MIKNNWVRVFSVGLYIGLHIIDSSCSCTVLWDYVLLEYLLSLLGSDSHPPVSSFFFFSPSFSDPFLLGVMSWWGIKKLQWRKSLFPSAAWRYVPTSVSAGLSFFCSSGCHVLWLSVFFSSGCHVLWLSVFCSSGCPVLCLSVFCSSSCHVLFFFLDGDLFFYRFLHLLLLLLVNFLFASSSRSRSCRLIKCGAMTVLTLSFCYGLILMLLLTRVCPQDLWNLFLTYLYSTVIIR